MAYKITDAYVEHVTSGVFGGPDSFNDGKPMINEQFVFTIVEKDNGQNEYNFSSKVTKSIMLYAIWEEVPFVDYQPLIEELVPSVGVFIERRVANPLQIRHFVSVRSYNNSIQQSSRLKCIHISCIISYRIILCVCTQSIM